MTAYASITARARFVSLARRGLAVAAVAAAITVAGMPALSTSAAGSCPSATGGDFDYDGISCVDESWYGTDPYSYDTDLDGYGDYEELYSYGTDPLDPSSYPYNPIGTGSGSMILVDSDFDGLSDDDELNFHGTDPFNADTDFDGLSDGVEFDLPSNPLFPDTDGDGTSDGIEFQAGSDLLDPTSFPRG